MLFRLFQRCEFSHISTNIEASWCQRLLISDWLWSRQESYWEDKHRISFHSKLLSTWVARSKGFYNTIAASTVHQTRDKAIELSYSLIWRWKFEPGLDCAFQFVWQISPVHKRLTLIEAGFKKLSKCKPIAFSVSNALQTRIYFWREPCTKLSLSAVRLLKLTEFASSEALIKYLDFRLEFPPPLLSARTRRDSGAFEILAWKKVRRQNKNSSLSFRHHFRCKLDDIWRCAA